MARHDLACRCAAQFLLLAVTPALLATADADSVPLIQTPPLEPLPKGVVESVDERGQVTLRSGEETIVVRLAGAALHESQSAPVGLDALRNLVAGEECAYETVEPADGEEPPGVFLYRAPDGLFVNYEWIRQGWARAAARPAHVHRDAFRAVERRARALQKGHWAPARPARPAAAEAVATAPAPAADGQVLVYVTKSGKKYHLATCRFAKTATRSLTVEEAKRSYQPCSQCKPPS